MDKHLVNREGIEKITLRPTIPCFCRIGEQYMIPTVQVDVVVGDEYGELISLHEDYQDLSKDPLSLEELTAAVLQVTLSYYPTAKAIEVIVDNSAGKHMAVTLSKRYVRK